jgi:ribosomal protein S18 acetylase RimI-like enzyme
MNEADLLAFRRASVADAAIVRELTHAAYAKWVPVIGREPRPMLCDYVERTKIDPIEIAEQRGRAVGLIHMIRLDGYLLIENLAVHPDCQSAGIGSRLLARAEAFAKAEVYPEVRLYTNEAFATNVAFYLKRGYSVTGTEPFGNGNVVYFAKPVA